MKKKVKPFDFSQNPDAKILEEARTEKPKGIKYTKEEKRYMYNCRVCDYTWLSKIYADELRACPSCKSTKWNYADVCKACGSVKRKERKKK